LERYIRLGDKLFKKGKSERVIEKAYATEESPWDLIKLRGILTAWWVTGEFQTWNWEDTKRICAKNDANVEEGTISVGKRLKEWEAFIKSDQEPVHGFTARASRSGRGKSWRSFKLE
jgi:hypothetical protein